MEATKKTDWAKIALWILAAAFVVFLIYSVDSCEKARDRDARIARNVEILKNDSIAKQDIIGTLTGTQRALEVENAELKNQVWIKDENQRKLLEKFSRVLSASTITGAVQMSDLVLRSPDTIKVPCEDFSQFLEVKPIDSSYYIGQTIQVENGQATATIDSLGVKFKIYHNIGYIKNGLFKKDELSSQVTAANKNINFKSVQTQVTAVDLPWYRKWWVWLTTGGALGFLLKAL